MPHFMQYMNISSTCNARVGTQGVTDMHVSLSDEMIYLCRYLSNCIAEKLQYNWIKLLLGRVNQCFISHR